MTEILSKEQFLEQKKKYYKKIVDGAVFIISTDTIYGLSCDATNPAAVIRIRNLKERDTKPFSVIAPSKTWIFEHCDIIEKAVEKLPGPYTLITHLKNASCISFEVINGLKTLGVRLPDHWCSSIAQDLGFPLVTTSVNRTGHASMTSLEDVDPYIKEHVDFIIDEGEKKSSPSVLLNRIGEEIAR